jgi:hypothetical protein
VAKQLLQGNEVTIEYTTINKLLEDKTDNKHKDHMVLASSVYEKLEEINGGVIQLNAKIKGRVIS